MTEEKKYSEKPTLCNEVVYEDADLKLTKIWIWRNIRAVYTSKKPQVCIASLYGKLNNGKSALVSYTGERLTDLEFDYMDDGYEMILVRIKDKGYGYINEKGKIVIPAKYNKAGGFCNGYAPVHDGNEWLYVDEKGKELRLENKYERLGHFSDELARVSTLNIEKWELAYDSDYSDDAGTWGYVDKTGKEIIKPQYIYAFDFINDRAIVAKGEWTIDEKWDNERKHECYWTEEELWGVIDKNGNEIIPCIFDEIKQFMNYDEEGTTCEDYYQVHIGGWSNGKWAIMDRNGNFITKPFFEDIYYHYFNGIFTFRNENTYEVCRSGIA